MKTVSVRTSARPAAPLEVALRDAEALLGVRLTLHDLSGVFIGPEGRSLLPRRHSHRRYPACAYGFDMRCLRHCYRDVNRQAAAAGAPWVHRCWKGISEIVLPLRREGIHVGTMFAGQWKSARKPPATLDRRARTAIGRMPPMDAPRMKRLGEVLACWAEGLLTRAEAWRRIDRPFLSRREAIGQFIALHASEAVLLRDLAQALHLSPSRTSHLVREVTGQSFRSLLVAERIRKAKALLRSTDLTVGEVGRLAGIRDESYFSRMFRAHAGVSPGAYRRRGALSRGRA